MQIFSHDRIADHIRQAIGRYDALLAEYLNRSGTCWQPYVKGYVPMINSIYNGLRMEDVWLDK